MKKIFLVCLLLGTMILSGCVPVVEQKCGIETCHGLDITCGSNIPEVCTEQYLLGDFCRQYASCEIIDEECQLVKDDRFDACKPCVEACNELDVQQAFECEGDCRAAMAVPLRETAGPEQAPEEGEVVPGGERE